MHKTYILVGPLFGQSAVPRAEIDVRDWLFRTVIQNKTYDGLLGLNDGFDALTLVRVWVVQIDLGGHSRQRFSLAVRARTPSKGYAVRSVRAFPSSGFACACSKARIAGGTSF